MKKITALAFCMLSLTCFAQKQKTNNTRFAGLDTAFARVLKDWKAAGFAVAVVEKDKVIYAKGFGYKDFEKKTPVTENTLFAIGSCTKAFTASLIGLLNKDGKVNLDKPVRTYLPALNFYNSDMNNNVTLRDMICHRTGVPRYDWSWYSFPSRSRDSLMQRLQYMEPTEPLRRKFQYNNFMFMLQGMVAEKLTGKSWEDNIREKIFAPAGMNNSYANLAEWMNNKDIAVGYNLKHDSIITKIKYYDERGIAPAGSIASSVSDMAKWLTVWMNGGKYMGKEILPVQYITEAISSQMVIEASLPSKETADLHMSNYGLGWFLSSYRGHYRVEHGGNVDGFSASTCFFPSDSIGIVVLCNQDGSAVPIVIRDLLADKMLGLKYRDWETIWQSEYAAGKAQEKEAMKTRVLNRKTGTTPSHTLSDYTGTYTTAAKESCEIWLKNDSLFVSTPSNDTYWYRHYNYDVFELLGKDETGDTTQADKVKAMFNMDENGNIVSISTILPEGNGKPVVFIKEIKSIKVSADSLQKYVGDYNLRGTTIKVYIKGENSLYLFVPGQPEYELIATDKDKFTIKTLTGHNVHFTRNATGEVTELTSIQPGVSFKALRVIKP